MNELKCINQNKLSNAEFRTLFDRLHTVLSSLNLNNARWDNYVDLYHSLGATLDDDTQARHSLKSYDIDCDEAWTVLMYQAKASSISFNAKRQSAGQVVNAIIEQFGNVTNHAFDTEYAEIHKALDLLEAIDSDVLKDALVDDVVAILHERYDRFMTARHEENIKRTAFKAGANRDARNALISAWQKLAAYIEVLADTDEKYVHAIAEINNIIGESKKNA